MIVTRVSKKISSSVGHQLATASPFFETRLQTLDQRLEIVRRAILERDFERFGREIEREAISLHMIAMTAPFEGETWSSGAYYWTPETMELILAVQDWRAKGLETYFTLDAGPTVHLLCRRADETRIVEAVREQQQAVPGRRWEIMLNRPAAGARVLSRE